MDKKEITFQDLGLSEAMLKALEKKGYGYPTTIQAEAIPHFMEWKDVIAKAPTGTGKTMAFGIPIIERIDPESEAVQAVILAPTRELAMQITDEMREVAVCHEGVRLVCLYGGQPIGKQIIQKIEDQIIAHYANQGYRVEFVDLETLIEQQA